MKYMLYLCLTLILSIPGLAAARTVKITTQLKRYNGPEAYMAIYLTDQNGQYQQTLWVAGYRHQYYRHLPGWARGSKLERSEYDGRTGASLLGGESITVTADIADQFIDSGYEIRVDTAIEDRRENRAEVIAPLTTAGSDQAVDGKAYVKTLIYTL